MVPVAPLRLAPEPAEDRQSKVEDDRPDAQRAPY
jgi:hypothetical protein